MLSTEHEKFVKQFFQFPSVRNKVQISLVSLLIDVRHLDLT